jgi:hypothetical protein
VKFSRVNTALQVGSISDIVSPQFTDGNNALILVMKAYHYQRLAILPI